MQETAADPDIPTEAEQEQARERARARAKYENLAVAFLLNSDKKQYGDLISSKPSRTNTPTGQTRTPLC
jgi:hypothetical protein